MLSLEAIGELAMIVLFDILNNMDYTKTGVIVTSQEEYTKAIEFYKSKWFNKNYLYANREDINDRKCLSVSNINNVIVWSNDMYYIDITEEVLWCKKTIESKFKVGDTVIYCDTKCKILDINDGFITIWYMWDNVCVPIDVIEKQQPTLTNNSLWKSRLYDKIEWTFTEIPFTPSQPTKMTQINTDLFERFIKGTKTQVLDSVERAENSLEERNELITSIRDFYDDYASSKESLKWAYNNQDKQSIKKYLKEVQSKEDILKDELFQKQLFPVIKSINKTLEKKNK